jgi:hypothetical protein
MEDARGASFCGISVQILQERSRHHTVTDKNFGITQPERLVIFWKDHCLIVTPVATAGAVILPVPCPPPAMVTTVASRLSWEQISR